MNDTYLLLIRNLKRSDTILCRDTDLLIMYKYLRVKSSGPKRLKQKPKAFLEYVGSWGEHSPEKKEQKWNSIVDNLDLSSFLARARDSLQFFHRSTRIILRQITQCIHIASEFRESFMILFSAEKKGYLVSFLNIYNPIKINVFLSVCLWLVRPPLVTSVPFDGFA